MGLDSFFRDFDSHRHFGLLYPPLLRESLYFQPPILTLHRGSVTRILHMYLSYDGM